MATLALMAAGSAIGSALLPSGVGLLGAALTGAQIGSALGGALGGMLDQRLLGSGSTAVQGPRLQDLRLTASTEGASVPRLFGTLRLGGQVLWASRFSERRTTRKAGGGKGAPSARVTEYSYAISLAVGLCEGPISSVGRIWADGQPMDLSGVTWRLHRGTEDQEPDPLILALEGASNAPAYRGLAYLVFEDLPLAAFGDRVPQISVETRRAPEEAESPTSLIRGVTLIPGAGEWVLNADPVILEGAAPGASAAEQAASEGLSWTPNLNASAEVSDLVLSLDQLQDQAPNLESAALVVSWFGDDLRCGSCQIRPGVEHASAAETRAPWMSGGVGRLGGRLLAQDGSGHAVYGGTPADAGVVSAIRDLRRRGLRVVFYPFLMMEVLPTNALPDPWTGASAQPAFPWRGRITLSKAPSRPGSPDQTPAAAAEVASFFGSAAPGDFGPWNGLSIPYYGPAEWSFRRQILHYAHLCKAAGGVEAFLIGSEMRGLTQIRSGPANYPAVAAFKALAADVRAILGPATQISYAADWSEYFGHHPQDGSGDVFFHLDPLWSDPNIDFVGIDNYLPLSDWREGSTHLDAAAGSIQNLDYLRANVEGGEGYDWFYASASDRSAQIRTPITDGAHGEPWVFRPKDIRNWWSRPHHDRPGGIRSPAPTAWTPGSKPIWFTECGCPAVDKGANQPNVFHDPKSSESALPYFSTGARDDAMQSAYLQALLGYWSDPSRNPPGFLDASNIHVWTWDARPYPQFPLRTDLWSDGPNWALGHWLTGRLGSASLAAAVREICAAAGEPEADASRLEGSVAGYALDRSMSAREALTPLSLVHGFDAVESAGRLIFVPRGAPPAAELTEDDLVLAEAPDSEVWSLTRAQESDLPAVVRVVHLRPESEDRRGAAEAAAPGASGRRVEILEAPMALDSAAARFVAERWLAEAWAGREKARFALPPSRSGLQPGDVIRFAPEGAVPAFHRIDRLEDSLALTVEATRVEPPLHRPASLSAPLPSSPRSVVPGPLIGELADLPMGPSQDAGGGEAPLWAAAFASPWTGPALLWREAAPDEWVLAARLETPAVMGRLLEPLPPSSPHLWTRGAGLLAGLAGGGSAPPLLGRPPGAVYNGANAAAIRTPSGAWEIVQFSAARLEAPGVWRLGPLLRGRAGTEHLCAEALPAGSRFLLLDEAVVPVPEAPLGLTRRWRFAPASLSWADSRASAQEAASGGAAFRPYSPARLRADLEPSGDLSLSWSRRSRGSADGWSEPEDPPLNETREAYRLEIRSGGLLRRAETLTAPSFLYSAAARASDGASLPLDVSVAQLSASFGPGVFTRTIVDAPS
ncbi:baseplate multidomain protein megatron [Neomegalonema perideroedes]|uniref:baseplate multidomain protein megatron n=1 Tax=Neomegalonema perideroedes TaxID=217219 RepID=UPI00036C7B18|nr:glycoside hydrolase/phage tail family protein [Neomegalonema perideroedes]